MHLTKVTFHQCFNLGVSEDNKGTIEIAFQTFVLQGEVEHNWGEMDKNAVTTDQATRRLAVCNLDWDRVTASDLLGGYTV